MVSQISVAVENVALHVIPGEQHSGLLLVGEHRCDQYIIDEGLIWPVRSKTTLKRFYFSKVLHQYRPEVLEDQCVWKFEVLGG